MLAGAACAALMIFAAPVQAATNPEVPISVQSYNPAVDQPVSAFYASRRGAALWLGNGMIVQCSSSGDGSNIRPLAGYVAPTGWVRWGVGVGPTRG